MSIIDAIKNSVLEGFDTNLGVTDIIFSLGVSLLAGLFILLVYKYAMKNVVFNRSFGITLLLVCSISSLIVLTITSNLALSLGMVGALSIVRFRTAIKDASDTAFMFWAVAAGITAGAGFFLLTLIGCLFIGAVCMLSVVLCDHSAKPYLLVVRAGKIDISGSVSNLLEAQGVKYKLSSLVENESYVEIIYELAFTEKHDGVISSLKEMESVSSVSLVDCRKN